MTACQGWSDAIWAAMDGELDEHGSLALLGHLRECADCQADLRRAVGLQRHLCRSAVHPRPGPGPSSHRVPVAGSARVRARPTRSSRAARAQTRRRQRGAPVWVAAALALAALVALPHGRSTAPPAPPFARLSLGGGEVTLLRPGQEVAIAAGDRGRVVFADGSVLELSDGARLVLDQGGRRRDGGGSGVQVALAEGRVVAEVAQQEMARPLVFTTGEAEAVVVGTRLTLSRSAGITSLAVEEGTVRFTPSAGDPILVTAGGSARATAAAEVVVDLVAGRGLHGEGGWVSAWEDAQGRRAVAVSGDGRPRLTEVDGRPALCHDGVLRGLDLSLGQLDIRPGFCLLVAMRPVDAGRDERVLALLDGTEEVAAIVRSGPVPAVAPVTAWAGNALLGMPARPCVLALRVGPDGAADLSCDGVVTGVGRLAPPAPLAAASLGLGHGAHGGPLVGDLFAVRLLIPAPDDAALTVQVGLLSRSFTTGVAP